jgi:hypothetical protein
MKLILALSIFFSCAMILFNNHRKEVSKNSNDKAIIVVNDLKPGIKIPDDFLGLSYEVPVLTDTSYFKSSHTKFKNLINNLGEGVLRLNGYFGNFEPWGNHPRTALMTKANINYLTDTLATSDLDSLFAFMRATKWKVILGLNDYKSTKPLMISEVRYALSKGSDVILALEVGNEPDGFFKGNYQAFRKTQLPWYDTLKDTFPGIQICGPASVHPEATGFIIPFIRYDSDKVNFITVHEYSVGDSRIKETVPQLLDEKYITRAYKFSHDIDSMVQLKHTRYRIDECNNFGDEGPNVADRFASALWGIDYMFTVAENNSLGINFHGGGRGFTPIAVRRNVSVSPQPLYYAMLFFHLAGQGKLLPVNMNTNNPGIKAYAVLGRNNTVFVSIINKDVNNDVNIQLRCKSLFSKASITRLLSPTVFSKDSVTLGGAPIDQSGKWQAKTVTSLASSSGSFNIVAPKGSATLVTIRN